MKSIDKLIDIEKEIIEFGFSWPNFQMIIDQAISECKEIMDAVGLNESEERIREEIGDLLHSAISMCIYKNFNIEEVINYTAEKFAARTEALKYIARDNGFTTLKNQPIELLLDLWHKAKLAQLPFNNEISIRNMSSSDIPVIVEAFKIADWLKPPSLFDDYLTEQESDERLNWVAYYNGECAGYVTLKWKSEYQSFLQQNIPEIKDLNVLPKFRNKGIGSKLIKTCEKAAKQKVDKIGLGVGLYSGYGSALKLYIQNFYKPDGNGITYNYKTVDYNQNVLLDDDLILWFTKNLDD
jgi:GNAT superfamily N-acetyltransferase/NTP pyrophosphatase (non-canonical NTP hydrolase)